MEYISDAANVLTLSIQSSSVPSREAQKAEDSKKTLLSFYESLCPSSFCVNLAAHTTEYSYILAWMEN